MSTLNPAGVEKRVRRGCNDSFVPTVHLLSWESVSCVRKNRMRGQIRGGWPHGQVI